MRWESFELWGVTEGKADELGNPTLTPGKICDAKGRITQWSAEEISIEGRDLYQFSQEGNHFCYESELYFS